MNKTSQTPPTVYPIASLENLADPFQFIRTLLELKAPWIQIRAKTQSHINGLIDLVPGVIQMRNAISPLSKIILNDFVELAIETGADGVHLGQTDQPSPIEARKLLGPDAIIGFSTHTPLQAMAAPMDCLTYLACGPVFLSGTKAGHAPEIGIAGVMKIKKYSTLPLVAIGGITSLNALEVFAAGADSIAVIGALGNRSDSEIHLEYDRLLESKPKKNLSSS